MTHGDAREAEDAVQRFGETCREEDERERRRLFAAIAVTKEPLVKTAMFLLYDERYDDIEALVHKAAREAG